MKLQTILLLTGIAAGLMTVSCQSSTQAEAEAFFGPPPKGKAAAEAEERAGSSDFYAQVNGHIDRRLNEFNEKEEAKLPIFSSRDVRDEFLGLSFIQSAMQIRSLSIDFAGPQDIDLNVFFDRESRTFTRTVNGKTEEYTFAPFTNGVPPAIPYDIHILYAFVADFSRIAETITVRCYEKLEKGENPGIAKLENEANIDEKGRKKNKNFVEIKPKVTYEPIEYRIDNRWCKCYDVKLKSICAPATALALYVSSVEKTLSRVDVILDDDSKIAFNIDWREQDGIVLPRVIRRLSDNAVFFREDAKIIQEKDIIDAEVEAAREAEAEEAAGETEEETEEEMVEFDVSGDNVEEEASEEEEDGFEEE
ncbi:MAG: hypothetical protein IJT68_02470 [Lentisphaeria bacterium]|nr:hypothetical protein [Lentisphaeria bacterium]